MALGNIGTWLAGRASRQSKEGARLSILTLLNYSLPALVTSIIIIPVIAVLPTIYEKYYGVNFAVLGIMLVLSRGKPRAAGGLQLAPVAGPDGAGLRVRGAF